MYTHIGYILLYIEMYMNIIICIVYLIYYIEASKTHLSILCQAPNLPALWSTDHSASSED